MHYDESTHDVCVKCMFFFYIIVYIIVNFMCFFYFICAFPVFFVISGHTGLILARRNVQSAWQPQSKSKSLLGDVAVVMYSSL